ncbi:hypothetical protein ACLESD_32775 [Pyxidicoccus sp. 3LFB2]
MTRALLASLLFLAVGLSPRVEAFSVDDHRALTQAALDSAGASGLSEYRDAVLHGSTAEDLNLHVKWTGWHHFYRPEGHIHSALREGSDARVRDLWDEALEAARHGDMAARGTGQGASRTTCRTWPRHRTWCR